MARKSATGSSARPYNVGQDDSRVQATSRGIFFSSSSSSPFFLSFARFSRSRELVVTPVPKPIESFAFVDGNKRAKKVAVKRRIGIGVLLWKGTGCGRWSKVIYADPDTFAFCRSSSFFILKYCEWWTQGKGRARKEVVWRRNYQKVDSYSLIEEKFKDGIFEFRSLLFLWWLSF